MSNLIGMDVAAMSQVAVSIDVQARRIQAAIGTIDGLVQQIAQDWRGPAAREFVGWWQGQHRPSLLRAEAALSGLAQAARNNISQQNHASGVGQGVAAFPGSTVVSGASVLGASVAAAALGSAAAGAAAAGGVSGTAISATATAAADAVASNPVVNADPASFAAQAGLPYDKGEWCGTFAAWVLHKSGAPLPTGTLSNGKQMDWNWAPDWVTAAQNHQFGLSITSTPAAGDFALYTNPDGQAQHIGVVTSDPVGGHFTTVQGNFDMYGNGQYGLYDLAKTDVNSNYNRVSGQPFGGQTLFVRYGG